jgi:CRP-like cAMP-binding protein
MSNPIIRKLELFSRLSTEDKAILTRVASGRVRHVGPREDVIHEGDHPRDINLFLAGWACRYKQLEDGRRQIIAYFLPGDLCDLNVYILREMDHSIGTITPVMLAEISREVFDEIMLNHPRVMQALWWESLVNAAVQREWTVNLGQRSATERVAHLICELFLRLRSVGLTQEHVCEWPITQAELADTTGMTAVHVNRTLQELRSLGLIELKDRHLSIPKFGSLMELAMFNPNYLHLQHEGAYLDANRMER